MLDRNELELVHIDHHGEMIDPNRLLQSHLPLKTRPSCQSHKPLEEADRVQFVEETGGGFRIVPATRDIKELKGIIPKPKRPVSVEEMKQAIAGRAARGWREDVDRIGYQRRHSLLGAGRR
ncbi:MAG: hypothetical protein ACKVQA_16585 [Burkholderiales bacterium]